MKFRAQQLKAAEVVEKIHPNTGQKTTWGVLTDSLVIIFRGVCTVTKPTVNKTYRLPLKTDFSVKNATFLQNDWFVQ